MSTSSFSRYLTLILSLSIPMKRSSQIRGIIRCSFLMFLCSLKTHRIILTFGCNCFYTKHTTNWLIREMNPIRIGNYQGCMDVKWRMTTPSKTLKDKYKGVSKTWILSILTFSRRLMRKRRRTLQLMIDTGESTLTLAVSRNLTYCFFPRKNWTRRMWNN